MKNPILQIAIRPIIFCLLAFLPSLAALAQPAWSRGEQLMPIPFEEAMRRANAALQSEGYVNLQSQANVVTGYKGTNTAIFMCNQAPDGKQWINLVVATITYGGGPVPDAERVKLQARINDPNLPLSNSTTSGGTADWSTSPGDKRGRNGERFTYTCPANGYVGGRVYGSDVYTDDSSICTAAVHAGAITHAAGGTVTIEIKPGASSYGSTTRNGVSSAAWGEWPGSFMIVR